MIPFIGGRPVVMGGAGFVGSAMARALDQKDGAVIVFRDEFKLEKLGPVLDSDNIFLVKVDDDWLGSSSYEMLNRIVEHTGTVFHFAAQSSAHIHDMDSLVETIASNVNLTVRMALLAGKNNKKMVYTSTSHSYLLYENYLTHHDDDPDVIDENFDVVSHFSEQGQSFFRWLQTKIIQYEMGVVAKKLDADPKRIIRNLIRIYLKRNDLDIDYEGNVFDLMDEDLKMGFYGLSKIMAEKVVLALPDGNGMVVRMTNVWGEGMRVNNVPSVFMRKHIEGESVEINAASDTRNFVHIDDVIHALRQLSEIDFDENQFFLIGNPDATFDMQTVARLAIEAVQEQTGDSNPVEIQTKNRDRPIVFSDRMSLDKARKILFKGRGYTPLHERLRNLARALLEVIQPNGRNKSPDIDLLIAA